MCIGSAGVTPFIALHFTALPRCCVFYKLEARPSISKKITACFFVMLALLRGRNHSCKASAVCPHRCFYFLIQLRSCPRGDASPVCASARTPLSSSRLLLASQMECCISCPSPIRPGLHLLSAKGATLCPLLKPWRPIKPLCLQKRS